MLKDTVLAALLDETDISHEKDIRPWLGQRAGAAAYPPSAKGAAWIAAALQFTDEAAMTAAMTRLAKSEGFG